MRLAVLAGICCMLLYGGPTSAQTPAKNDPVTGIWSGDLAPDNTDRRTITLDLKLDAKGRVTGTLAGLPNPGDVKAGTFDRKTGTLKLQLGRTDDPAVLLTLDGKLAGGTITGRMSGEPGTGTFSLKKKP